MRQHRGVVAGTGRASTVAVPVAGSIRRADGEEESPPGDSEESTLRKENSQLKRALADKTLELDFFKGALQKVEARRRSSEIAGEKASTTKSKK